MRVWKYVEAEDGTVFSQLLYASAWDAMEHLRKSVEKWYGSSFAEVEDQYKGRPWNTFSPTSVIIRKNGSMYAWKIESLPLIGTTETSKECTARSVFEEFMEMFADRDGDVLSWQECERIAEEVNKERKPCQYWQPLADRKIRRVVAEM